MMYTVKIIKRVKKEDIESVIDLAVEFPNSPETDHQTLFDGTHHDFVDPKHGRDNDKLIWSYRRLYNLAFEMDMKSALDIKVLQEYHRRTEEMIAEKPSQRAYRGYFKNLISAMCPEHKHLFVATDNRTSRRTQSKNIDMGQFHNVEENISVAAEILSSPERSRKRVAPSDESLVMVPSNVAEFNPYLFYWKDSNNKEISIDVKVELNHDFCDEALHRRVADSFRNSQLAQATKFSYFAQLRKIFDWKVATGNKHEPTSQALFKNYLYDLQDKARKGDANVKSTTVSRYQRGVQALLKLFGLPKIPKPELIKVSSGGNDLVSDAYQKPEWTMSVRALHLHRRKLLDEINRSPILDEVAINDYSANVLLMTTVYTAATQKELFTATFPDQVVSYERNGKDHWITKGVKNRSNEIKKTELKFKQNGKRMLEEFLPISRKVNAFCKNTEYQLFVALEDGKSREFTGADLYRYESRLFKETESLREYKKANPDFSIRTQRIRSSITSKVQSERGEGSAVVAGRHSLKVHRQSKYSRNNKQVNQKELAAQAHVMEHFGRNSGNIKLAIETVEKQFDIQVLTPLAAKEMREKNTSFNDLPNGGTCKNHETKEKKQFQRKIDSNPLLTDSDKQMMGCGFIVKCFWCDNFAVVDEVVDIWRLLSFEQKMRDSFSQHQGVEHYIKNYADLQISLDKLKEKFTPLNLRVAKKRLEKEVHPFWADEYVMKDVLRSFS
ncbi:hypothetical protein V12B01_25009 [Vibrio splendidus 12B01]|uniref:hypothetical protein n=1 Tax=Vibrio TaxID=662 RepID=UPI000066F940|nr:MULTISPECIES: hypothetical protein [Vibrio]EAP96286.1 hypothetical protein V12B01_25009 [Vibrio splendidus 12B01]TKF96874.1 hypothetical protein FCV71_10385 [Vibrio lentus]